MATTATAAKPLDKDAANRKEIIRTIKGPVVERLLKLVPALAVYPDVYATMMTSPELLHGCMQVFRKQREHFQDMLLDAAGAPVEGDDTPLKCERTVNQIIGMVVRSGAKGYAEKRFGTATGGTAKTALKPETKSLIEKLAALVTGKWSDAEVPKTTVSQADQFYGAIKDNLDYDWQVPLIPHFAELPVKLLRELGKGVTTLHTPEGIAALADVGRHNMEQAKRILTDDMMREMLDTQPLAAKGIAFLGKDRYDFLHGAVYERMGEKFWDMCVDCDRLEAMETQNAKDLEQMASHLHVISGDSISFMVRFLLFAQIPIFLEVANDKLGEEKFIEVFGVPGNKKLIKIFCEKVAATKLDPGDPEGDLRRRLPDVFGAYLRAPKDFERGL
jgi:hypothetical protein